MPFRGRLLSGVMRACRGSTRPSHLGQRSNSPARFPLQETVGAFGQQQGNGVKNHRMHSRGVLFGESLHEARVEEQAAKHVPGTRRSSDLIERWGVSRGTQFKIRCSTEKRRSHREMVVGTLRVNPSHTVERGAGWLRSEDLAMSGVRELRLLQEGNEASVSGRLGGRLSDRPTVMHQGHQLGEGNLERRAFGRIGSRHRVTQHRRDAESG